MGTIIHDHVVITLDSTESSEIGLVSAYLIDHFSDTSFGPIKSITNGFVTFGVTTFGVTTSGSKHGFDTKTEYTEKICKLLSLCDIINASFIHLQYGDKGDGPAIVKDCSIHLKENYYDGSEYCS